MNVSLTPELESLVHDKVESGLYTSASEVVREALRLLSAKDAIQQQRLAEFRERSRLQSRSENSMKSLSELPEPGQSLAEALEGLIGVLESGNPGLAENAEEEFGKALVEEYSAQGLILRGKK